MNDDDAQRVRAGLSLMFAQGERPDIAALRHALEACQTHARIAQEDAAGGAVDLIVSGLIFEADGLAPPMALTRQPPIDANDFVADAPEGEQEAVRLFPGHHLSGGLSLAPVVSAMLALAAELAVSLPVHAVLWHPAGTAIEPQVFSRTVLAWLAGGAFPATELTALLALADGSVVSRGLAQFVGQEMTLRGTSGTSDLKLAAQVIDRIVREGPPTSFSQWRVHDTIVCVEPAPAAKQILVWQAP